MNTSSPDPLPPDASSVPGLLRLARETPFCKPALHTLAAALPADDAPIIAALDEAAEKRDAKSFSQLYLAALLASRHLPSRILANGTLLLPDAMFVAQTAPYLDGPIAEPLAEAVRSGRMTKERNATAIVTAWLDYERRGISAPPEFLALTRRICRDVARANLPAVKAFLRIAAFLSGDPLLARILRTESVYDGILHVATDEVRSFATKPIWRDAIPATPPAPASLATGAPLKRAAPKAGRNDPCPCGSGRKFKQCCEGKATIADQYQVEGVTLSAAADHPELLLTPQRVYQLSSHELYALNPELLDPIVVVKVVGRLATFGEVPRAIEILKQTGRDRIPDEWVDDIAFDFLSSRDAEALRWFIEWAGGIFELMLEMEILLATPAERLALLQAKAREAFEMEKSDKSGASLLFIEIGYSALIADEALGILIARGVMPACNPFDQEMLIHDIEDARDVLGLDDDDEPAYEVLDATAQTIREQDRLTDDIGKIRSETTARLNQRDAEIRKLKTQIDAMQETLVKRESPAAPKPGATTPAPTPPPSESAETRELRDNLRRLKENLKVEHLERNRALRDLRTARDQLRRASHDPSESPAPAQPAAESGDDRPAAETTDIAWEAQALRIPEYTPAFRNAMRNLPRQACAAALAVAGRLAGGDPSAWKTARALKMRPGTLRIRVAGDYRLLFETATGDTLRLIDFIPRRDLERWISAH